MQMHILTNNMKQEFYVSGVNFLCFEELNVQFAEVLTVIISQMIWECQLGPKLGGRSVPHLSWGTNDYMIRNPVA